MQYLTKPQESQIRHILDSLANQFGLKTEPKEIYAKEESYYLDRLWWVEIEQRRIPVVAFARDISSVSLTCCLRKQKAIKDLCHACIGRLTYFLYVLTFESVKNP